MSERGPPFRMVTPMSGAAVIFGMSLCAVFGWEIVEIPAFLARWGMTVPMAHRIFVVACVFHLAEAAWVWTQVTRDRTAWALQTAVFGYPSTRYIVEFNKRNAQGGKGQGGKKD
jgi:hypothetical protein